MAAREAAERAFAQQNAAFKVSVCSIAPEHAGACAHGKQCKIRHSCDADVNLAMPVGQAEQQRLKREAELMAAQTPEAAAEVPPASQSPPTAPEWLSISMPPPAAVASAGCSKAGPDESCLALHMRITSVLHRRFKTGCRLPPRGRGRRCCCGSSGTRSSA